VEEKLVALGGII